MDLQITSSTQGLIAEMEADISQLKQLSAEFNQMRSQFDYSPRRQALADEYSALASKFTIAYANDKSYRLEALNNALFSQFNQYLVDHVRSIEWTYKAPSFIEYILTPSPTDSA